MSKKIRALLITGALVYFFLGPLRELIESNDPFKTIERWSTPWHLLLIFTSYFSFFLYSISAYLLLHQNYQKEKRYKIISIIIALVPVIIGIRYFIQELLFFHLFGETNYNPNTSLLRYFTDNLYYAVVYNSIGIVYFFIQYSIYTESQKKEIQLQNKRTELAFLKSQLNPHFLFNILNNIYSLVNKKSHQSLDAMDKLSALLRYSLYESDEMVALSKELDYIHNYIDLQKMRYQYHLHYKLSLPKYPEGVKISPFTLIPFVENAFKHGNLRNKEEPLRIKLEYENSKIIFYVKNEKIEQEKDKLGGIGLENVKKRLELIYPTSHHLEIHDEETNYTIKLEIEVKECLTA